MTLSYSSKRDIEKEIEKERNPSIDECEYCGVEIHEWEWVRDEEGHKFCDKHCAEAFKEEADSDV